MRAEELSTGWINTVLADVAEWGSGGTPSRSKPSFFCGDIPWVKTGELGSKFVRSTEEYLSVDALQQSSAKVFPKGSVGIAMYGATIGKVSIWAMDAATNQACAVGQPFANVLFNEYLYYYLKSQQREFTEAGKGGAQPNISQAVIKSWPIPIPPVAEQRRIVAKIEELFSELDKAVESLTTAREQLKAYRQSVLKHAFEGKLTAGWRPDSNHRELPHGWQYLTVVDVISEPLANGRSVKDRATGFPVLRLTAFKNNTLNLGENKDGDWERDAALPFIVQEGDFFVARGNGSKHLVGIGGLARGVKEEVAFPDTMIRLRLNKSRIDSNYFALCWNSRAIRAQIERDARTTAGIYKINQDHIRAFSIPVAPLEEQRLIALKLEERLSTTDATLDQIEDQITRAETLRQSVLQHAFSGQLVGQDPYDEPASVLLDHIRAEKEKTAKPEVKRRAKGATA